MFSRISYLPARAFGTQALRLEERERCCINRLARACSSGSVAMPAISQLYQIAAAIPVVRDHCFGRACLSCECGTVADVSARVVHGPTGGTLHFGRIPFPSV